MAKPVLQEKNKNISIAVFENDVSGKILYTIMTEKAYKSKKDGEWQKQRMTLNVRETIDLIRLLDVVRQEMDRKTNYDFTNQGTRQ